MEKNCSCKFPPVGGSHASSLISVADFPQTMLKRCSRRVVHARRSFSMEKCFTSRFKNQQVWGWPLFIKQSAVLGGVYVPHGCPPESGLMSPPPVGLLAL